MKPIVINKNSWHYKMLKALQGAPTNYEQLDICSYSRKVLIGILMIAFVFACLFVVAGVAVEFLFGVIFSILYWSWIFSPIGEIIVLLLLICGLGGSIYLCAIGFGRGIKGISRSKVINDGFVGHAYKSWKHKYCAPIVINYNE